MYRYAVVTIEYAFISSSTIYCNSDQTDWVSSRETLANTSQRLKFPLHQCSLLLNSTGNTKSWKCKLCIMPMYLESIALMNASINIIIICGKPHPVAWLFPQFSAKQSYPRLQAVLSPKHSGAGLRQPSGSMWVSVVQHIISRVSY